MIDSEYLSLPDAAQMDQLVDDFSIGLYARMPSFLTDIGLEAIQAEAARLMVYSKRKDFLMSSMDDSPRRMSTVGGKLIEQESELITSLYSDSRIKQLCTQMSGLELVEVPDPLERHVLNYLHAVDDVHGAHFDDYPIALVVFLVAPSEDEGGVLEYVPFASTLSELDGEKVQRARHAAGDAYLLRTDMTAHRVSPIAPGATRIVLNLAYTTSDIREASTDTAAQLYD